jgi:hypothetical protein
MNLQSGHPKSGPNSVGFRDTEIKMSLAINTVGDELQSSADYCRTEGIGLEITDFAFPGNLDSNQKYLIDKHIKSVQRIKPLVCHGPFFELNAVGFYHFIISKYEYLLFKRLFFPFSDLRFHLKRR